MGQSTPMAATTLIAAVSSTESDSIYVQSTVGFAPQGIIQIDQEQIGYAETDTNRFSRKSFVGATIPTQQVVRGANGTTAAVHSVGARVYTPEGSMLNQSLNYQLATLTDSSGIMVFITVPINFIKLLASFLILPLGFLGTDLAILTYIWGCVSIGILISIGIAVAGGRKAS